MVIANLFIIMNFGCIIIKQLAQFNVRRPSVTTTIIDEWSFHKLFHGPDNLRVFNRK